MGDRALLVELGDEISHSVNQRVQELSSTMSMNPIDGVRELVPSYRSLLMMGDRVRFQAITAEEASQWQQ